MKTAIKPTRAENYPEWYQQVITAADLAENSPVRGCMVIKPWGYAIWENIQQQLDQRFKATGHQNAYFPLLIPLSHLEKEAQHVEGFAKECAVVTHHKLVDNGAGGLKAAGELEEPLIIRPTSETMIGPVFANWVQSHRDLPLLINQWANVMRWEMRTRMFLRTSEFLWQEGHTAHATADEALAEAKQMLDVYAEFAHTVLAMPVIKGEKTTSERFPGADHTYCIEAIMQDGKALQAGTSHFLGQNFSKAYDITYTSESGQLEHVWMTSWGVSTRLVGGLIMTHSDDDGLVLPPSVAPQHVVILPIYRSEEDQATVLAFCDQLRAELVKQRYQDQPVKVIVDKRDLRGGVKNWEWVKKGVPLRIEVGPRDIEQGSVMLARRDQPAQEKQSVSIDQLSASVPELLTDIQATLLARAQAFQVQHSHEVSSLEEFNAYFREERRDAVVKSGFVQCFAADDPAIDDMIKPLKVTPRCIPLEQDGETGQCIFTGKPTSHKIIFARSY